MSIYQAGVLERKPCRYASGLNYVNADGKGGQLARDPVTPRFEKCAGDSDCLLADAAERDKKGK